MDELLKVLAEWLQFLFNDNRYRIVSSAAHQGCGDAWIELASSHLRWLLVRERGEVVLLCFRPDGECMDGNDWISMDIIHTLLTGEVDGHSTLTPPMARRIECTLPEIEAAFAPDRVDETLSRVGKLQREREDRMFGPRHY